MLVYRNATVNLAAYNAIMLDPVTMWAAPSSRLGAIPPDQQQAAVNIFYSDL